MIANVGCRGNYKMVLDKRESLLQLGIPELVESNSEKCLKLAGKVLTGLSFALLALDTTANNVFAATAKEVSLGPFEGAVMDVYWLMFRGILYVSIPALAWVGYTIAFSGNNSGKRTAAKVALFSIIGGNISVASAPWAARFIYDFCKSHFSM
jgi:hypothetical protein